MIMDDKFDYKRLLGPIGPDGEEPEAIRMYKASAGAQRQALRDAGRTEEQIENGMRTHFESAARVLVEHLHGVIANTAYSDPFRAVALALVDKIDPAENPCGRTYCLTCYPEQTL
jgi:hypothetical protein